MTPPQLLATTALLIYGGLVSAQTDAVAGAAQICETAFADKRLDRLRSKMPVTPFGGDGKQLTKQMLRDSRKAAAADNAALDVLLEAQLACAKATFEEMGGDAGRRLANDADRRAQYSARLAPLQSGSMSFGEFNVAQEIDRAIREVRARDHIATLNCAFPNDGFAFDIPVVVNYGEATVNGVLASFEDTTISWSDRSGAEFVLNRFSGTVSMKKNDSFNLGSCLPAVQKF